MSSNVKKPPVAPPVYRPQATPRVLQKKDRPGSQVVQPKVYRPEQKKPVAPPAYRPQPKPVAQPKVGQQKTAQPKIARSAAAGSKPNSSVVQRAEWLTGLAIGAAAIGVAGAAYGLYSWATSGPSQQAGGPPGLPTPTPTPTSSVVPSRSSGGGSGGQQPRRRQQQRSKPYRDPDPPRSVSGSSGDGSSSSSSSSYGSRSSSSSSGLPPSSPLPMHSGSAASVSGPHCASSSSSSSSSSRPRTPPPPRLPTPPSSDDEGDDPDPRRGGPKVSKWKVKGDGGAGARKLKVGKDEAMARGRELEEDDDGGPSGARGGYRRPKVFAIRSAKEYDKGEKGGVTCILNGRPIEQGTNSSIHQHAERRAIASAFPGKKTQAYNLAFSLNAWPCWDDAYGCHMWLQGCAMTEGITITVTITDDQGGYAVQHGKPAKSTGTLTYHPDGNVTFAP